MNFITAWILSILGIVVMGTVVDLLLTKSRLKNFIRSVFATVSILVIITPLPSIVKNGFNIELSDFSEEVRIDEDFVNFAERQKITTLEEAMKAAFAQEGMEGLSITLDASFANGNIRVKRVTVDLSNSVIKENLANINKYEFIKERVKSFIGDSEVEIIVNG